MSDGEAAAQSFEAAGWAIRGSTLSRRKGPSARPAGTLSGPPRSSLATKRCTSSETKS